MGIDFFGEDFLRIGIDAPRDDTKKVEQHDRASGPGRIGGFDLERDGLRAFGTERALFAIENARSHAPAAADRGLDRAESALQLHSASRNFIGRDNPNRGITAYENMATAGRENGQGNPGGKPDGVGKPE